MEHRYCIKDIAFYVQKHVTHCTVVITSQLVRDKPLGAPASVKRVLFLPTGSGCIMMAISSTASWRCYSNVKSVLFKLIIPNSSVDSLSKIALWWMPQNLTDDKSTLVLVMAWWHQEASQYLSHCWPDFCYNIASLDHNKLKPRVCWVCSAY